MQMLFVGYEQIEAFRFQKTMFESFGDEVAAAMLGPILIVLGVDYTFDATEFGDHDPNHMTFILPDGQVITDN